MINTVTEKEPKGRGLNQPERVFIYAIPFFAMWMTICLIDEKVFGLYDDIKDLFGKRK